MLDDDDDGDDDGRAKIIWNHEQDDPWTITLKVHEFNVEIKAFISLLSVLRAVDKYEMSGIIFAVSVAMSGTA